MTAKTKTKLDGYKNVTVERTRHGKTVYYFRLNKGPRHRLPGVPMSKEFDEAYNVASMSPNVVAKPVSKAQKNRAELIRKVTKLVPKARYRASGKDVPYDLDKEWAERTLMRQDYKCALTGLPFKLDDKPYTPSLDRIIPSVGYTQDNVRIVLLSINVMMLNWGEETFRHVTWHYQRNRKYR